MRTRALGSLEVPIVGLGCNNFGRRIDADATQAVVDAALDIGVTFFDTADVYGDGASEELLGRALGSRRDQVLIATKFGHPMGGPDRAGASPRWIAQAVEDSLRRLGTDHIDLYQQHTPDDEVPIEETLGALHELVEQGKVREIGNSNFDGQRLDAAEVTAHERGVTRFVCAQNEWSLLERGVEHEVVPTCERLGLAVLPYFPLASGVLTGKHRLGEPPAEGSRIAGMAPDRRDRFASEDKLRTAERLRAFAESRGHTLLELAFSWLASHDVVASVIAGATTPDQVRANAAAASWVLTDDERTEVDAITGS